MMVKRQIDKMGTEWQDNEAAFNKMGIWWNSKLTKLGQIGKIMKLLIDELTSWWNGKLTNWQTNEKASWQTDKLMK